VRQVLERRMAAEYELGQQIPTEQALCREFGVSRETVREALRGLERDGIVERHRAKGTFFIRRPDPPATEKLTGLVEDLTALRLNTRARVLGAAAVKAHPDARNIDGDAEEVFRISRLRYFDDQPLVLHEAYLPMAVGHRVAALDLGNTAISQRLDELGVRYVEESQQIEAMVADTELAQLLDIPIGAPVLLIRRLLRLPKENGRVLFKSYYRADRYRYTLNLAPPASTAAPRGSGKTTKQKPARRA
jgi:GntR family transcriptional regulator